MLTSSVPANWNLDLPPIRTIATKISTKSEIVLAFVCVTVTNDQGLCVCCVIDRNMKQPHKLY